jgi:oligopeptide/dipeptide ABC transporter ATP-binding protein
MIERLGEVVLDTVGVGLAIVRPDSRSVVLHNARLAGWFPEVAAAGATLHGLLPGLDAAGLEAVIADGRPWRQEIEIKVKRRAVILAVEISRYRGHELDVLIVESQNVSKVKELEYMIESYSAMVQRQNRSLRREKERVEKLLLNIMPKSIYEEMKTFGVTTPQRFDAASVLMLDFVGFTEMTVTQDPAALIAELNDIFTSFDRIAEQFGCERIKTIGDAYVAVAGLPEPSPDHAALNPRRTVFASIAEPLVVQDGAGGPALRATVERLLDEVGLPRTFLWRYPHELSGGQKQRVCIARALGLEPQLVVLDEPTSALDVSVQAQILAFLRDLQARHGLTYLLISHNLAVVRQLCTRVAVMYLGRIVEEGPTAEVFARPRHPYTSALVAAVLPARAGRAPARSLEGDPPDPGSIPAGCRFAPRCPFVRPACRAEDPVLRELAPGHRTACPVDPLRAS